MFLNFNRIISFQAFKSYNTTLCVFKLYINIETYNYFKLSNNIRYF